MVDEMVALKELVEETLEEFDRRVLEDEGQMKLLESEMEVQELIESNEAQFLRKLRERMVVLFEGLLDKEIVGIEEKLDLTLDFLEFALARIDERLEEQRGE